jgi:hypothetical protein
VYIKALSYVRSAEKQLTLEDSGETHMTSHGCAHVDMFLK